MLPFLQRFCCFVIFGVANCCYGTFVCLGFFDIFDSVVFELLYLINSLSLIFEQDFFDLFLFAILVFVLLFKLLFNVFLFEISIFVLLLTLLFNGWTALRRLG